MGTVWIQCHTLSQLQPDGAVPLQACRGPHQVLSRKDGREGPAGDKWEGLKGVWGGISASSCSSSGTL